MSSTAQGVAWAVPTARRGLAAHAHRPRLAQRPMECNDAWQLGLVPDPTLWLGGGMSPTHRLILHVTLPQHSPPTQEISNRSRPADAPSSDDGRCGDGHVGGDGQRVARRRARGRSRDGGPRRGRAVGVQQIRGREDLPVQMVDAASAHSALECQESDAVSKCDNQLRWCMCR